MMRRKRALTDQFPDGKSIQSVENDNISSQKMSKKSSLEDI